LAASAEAAKMEFWAALCIAGGATIGVLAFAFCLLKLLIFYESHRRIYLETIGHEWGLMIRGRREFNEASGIGEPPVASAEERKAQTVCITDPTVQIAIARAPRPAWPDQSEPAAKPDAWVVVIQPSESESA